MTSSAPSTAMTPSATFRRRRRTLARRAPTGARRLDAALAVPILHQLLKHFRQLDLQLLNRPVVAHDVVRFLGLFVLGQLARGTRLDQLMLASGSALAADVFVGHNGDGLVERVFHSRFE